MSATQPFTRPLSSDLRPLVIGLVLLGLWEFSGLDLQLERAWGSGHGFRWREHWFTANVMHDKMRAMGWLVLAYIAVSVWQPIGWAKALSRRERVWWLGTTIACAVLIPLLKKSSLTSCPWSLSEFGGAARYVPHWLIGVPDGGPGGCFPSGHASTAFSFIAGWFVLRDRHPCAARWWLGLTLAMGLALGVVQMVRGAHFASHSMWTAWICWAVSTASYHGLRGWRSAGQPRQDPAAPAHLDAVP